MSIQKILKSYRQEILDIASQRGATNIRIFGSVARGEDTSESDLDLLVDYEDDVSLLDHVGLIHDLEDLLDRKVEIATESSLHWYIKDDIIKKAIKL